MIIDNTYFIRGLSLPVDEISGQLNGYILSLEPEILNKILGYSLTKAFLAGLDVEVENEDEFTEFDGESFEDESTIEQKWLDLRDGAEFIYAGKTYKWMGFANTEKKSILANYIYVKFTTETAVNVTGTGAGITQKENSIRVDNRQAQVRVWNEMIEMIRLLHMFIIVNLEDYEDFDGTNYGQTNQFNV
jgi:hypothetical protein